MPITRPTAPSMTRRPQISSLNLTIGGGISNESKFYEITVYHHSPPRESSRGTQNMHPGRESFGGKLVRESCPICLNQVGRPDGFDIIVEEAVVAECGGRHVDGDLCLFDICRTLRSRSGHNCGFYKQEMIFAKATDIVDILPSVCYIS
jgi:hypothetical protein